MTQAGEVQRGLACLGFTQHSISVCLQATLAQQLCRQHIIAGEHILENVGPPNTRRWWTLAGQEITITFKNKV